MAECLKKSIPQKHPPDGPVRAVFLSLKLLLKNQVVIMTHTLTPPPVYYTLLYIWFGFWSLGYLVFIGWIKPAKDALVDWMMGWKNFEWASRHLGLVLLLLALVWPLTWLMIFRYWK